MTCNSPNNSYIDIMNIWWINSFLHSNPTLEKGVTITATSFLGLLWPILSRIEELIGIKYRLCDNPEFLKLFEWKTIAIVWNAPNIVGKWNEIDSHDIVIRFNYGVIPEFQDQENTWTKTDMMCFWSMQLFWTQEVEDCIKKSTASLLFNVWAPWKSSRPYFVLKLFIAYRKYMQYTPHAVIIPEDLWWELENSLWGEIPTTWYTTIISLLRFANFKNLSIYGFQFSSNNRILGGTSNATHSFDKEKYVLMRQIKERQNIKFHE